MNAVELQGIGKMYKLFDKTSDRVADVFGADKLRFWDRSPRFREFWALRDINLTVEKGERIGIIGRNGAGKSTLLKLITGNIQPTEGSIAIHGEIQALMQLGTGFHPEFTGIENIRTALSYNGVSRKRAQALEDEIIEFSELEDYINQPIKYYSAGMYSRLAFAVSTALEPDILIIDEVLGAGDAAFTSKCAARMKKLTQDTGATVLFVSHSMESVLEICERAVLIEKGRIVERGSALRVSKIYNKKIRQEEELRLRAKEYRISKRDMGQLMEGDGVHTTCLFHLCTDNPHPAKKHRIYSCTLSGGGIEPASLLVGAPMDNDENSLSRVIDGNTFMDWDRARRDGRGYYRFYQNKEGINCHAPFQISIPAHAALEELSLSIAAETDPAEPVYAEIWHEGRYERLGALQGGYAENHFALSVLQKPEEPQPEGQEAAPSPRRLKTTPQTYEEMLETDSIYGSQDLIITQVDLLDAQGKSRRVFTLGEELVFVIQLCPRAVIPRFTLVVDIMTRAGKVVGQSFCESEELGLRGVSQAFSVSAEFSPLRFGEDEYMVSIGVFKECDYTTQAENESYCVADRAIFFSVKQPPEIKKSMGSFAHPCRWRCGERTYLFDAAGLDL
ncbi:MAG: ABC transporter ATP-binding protein [Provencibacterium sp.]|jgi:lipopolysaccharide transport system ATP-binding protein|nr:ABC transporter ATP-binding protein [Provencibacterium sp.]